VQELNTHPPLFLMFFAHGDCGYYFAK